MHCSLTALIRLVGLLAVVACVVAVGLAKLEPSPARFRLVTPPRYGVIDGFVLASLADDPHFLDPSTGAVCTLKIPEGDRLDHASYSPWQDEKGEYQLVGRWTRQNTLGFSKGCPDSGLVRYSMPSGRVLNRITVDVTSASIPCWFPGTTARVLYAGANGKLYRIAFEGKPGSWSDDESDDGGETPAPQELVWKCPTPGRQTFIQDPVWPNDPRMRGRLVVSLSYLARETDTKLTRSRLWWLQLSGDGSAVVAAGPLTDPGTDAEALGRPDERYPNLAATPDGRLALAYLTLTQEKTTYWELRLAPVTFDPASGAPVVRPQEARTVVPNHVGALPSFSADGRWIFGVLHSNSGAAEWEVARFPTATAPASATPTATTASATPERSKAAAATRSL